MLHASIGGGLVTYVFLSRINVKYGLSKYSLTAAFSVVSVKAKLNNDTEQDNVLPYYDNSSRSMLSSIAVQDLYEHRTQLQQG